MITVDGRVKILDFGSARAARSAAVKRRLRNTTVPGMIVGTVSYMSPEQASGKPTDHRSDQFSFGLMLYRWRRGRRRSTSPRPCRRCRPLFRKNRRRWIFSCRRRCVGSSIAAFQRTPATATSRRATCITSSVTFAITSPKSAVRLTRRPLSRCLYAASGDGMFRPRPSRSA